MSKVTAREIWKRTLRQDEPTAFSENRQRLLSPRQPDGRRALSNILLLAQPGTE